MRSKGVLRLRLLALLSVCAIAVLAASTMAGANRGGDRAAAPPSAAGAAGGLSSPPGDPGVPSESTVPTPTIDLHVDVGAKPEPVELGTELAYTISVGNRGPDTATDVLLSAGFSATVAVRDVTTTRGSCLAGAVVVCQLGVVEAGALATVVVRVRPLSTGRLTNTVTALGSETDSNPDDNVATAVSIVYLPNPPRPPVARPPDLPGACVDFRVGPVVIRAGVTSTVLVVVAAGAPRKPARVDARGAGAHVVGATGTGGVAHLRIHPTRAGIVTVTLLGRRLCRGPRRIGVVAGVLRPPVTG